MTSSAILKAAVIYLVPRKTASPQSAICSKAATISYRLAAWAATGYQRKASESGYKAALLKEKAAAYRSAAKMAASP